MGKIGETCKRVQVSKSGGSTVLEPRVGVRATAVALGLQRLPLLLLLLVVVIATHLCL